MKRQEILALVVASLTVGFVLVSICFAIAPFLPDFAEQQRWILRQGGVESIPVIDENPVIGLLSVFTCSTPLVLLASATAVLLWRSARQQRRSEWERRLQYSDWSTSALLIWFDRLLAVPAETDDALRERIEDARRTIEPHLVEPQRRCFERVLERLSSGSMAASGSLPLPPRSRKRLRLLTNLLLRAAAAQVGLAGITGVIVAALEVYPILGMPLGTSAVFLGVTLWLAGAVVFVFAALGLRRLDARAAALEAEAEVACRAAVERLEQGFLASLKRAGTAAELAAAPRQHRVASALASALLETTAPGDRRRLLDALYASGHLRAPRALDLRGMEIGALDLSAVEWPGAQLVGTKLEGTSFAGAQLEAASLLDCRLRGASFQQAHCSGAILRGSDLRSVLAQRADFRHADLAGCDLTAARLWGADLSSADLRGARVERRQLARAATTRGALGLPAISSDGMVDSSVEAVDPAGSGSVPRRSGTDGWSARLEVWALICLHGAIFCLAGVSHTLTLYFGLVAGWLPPPTTPDERVLYSPVGFTLAGAPFLLAAAFLIGVAWRLRRSSEEDSGEPSVAEDSRPPLASSAGGLQGG